MKKNRLFLIMLVTLCSCKNINKETDVVDMRLEYQTSEESATDISKNTTTKELVLIDDSSDSDISNTVYETRKITKIVDIDDHKEITSNNKTSIEFVLKDLIWQIDNILADVNLEVTIMEELPNDIFQASVDELFKDTDHYDVETVIGEVMSAKFDMNADGLNDYFISLWADPPVGNSIPPLFLFLSDVDTNTYEYVPIPLKTEIGFEILKTQTNKVYDILWDFMGNVLKYNPDDGFVCEGLTSQLRALGHPVEVINNNIVHIDLIDIDRNWMSDVYDKYIVAVYFPNAEWIENKVVVSNDTELNKIIYTDIPTDGIYHFYIKADYPDKIPSFDDYFPFYEIKFIEYD